MYENALRSFSPVFCTPPTCFTGIPDSETRALLHLAHGGWLRPQQRLQHRAPQAPKKTFPNGSTTKESQILGKPKKSGELNF